MVIKNNIIENNRKVWSENTYYGMAEKHMDNQWIELVWPIIKDCDFSSVIDLAAGHGRNSRKLIEKSEKIVIVDFVESNIEKCKERFSSFEKVQYALCDGRSIPLETDSYSLVYCFDAMVHFEPEIVLAYLEDIYRVLKPGGKAFLHHSNNPGPVNVDWRHNPHARNYMTGNLFRYWAKRSGFKVLINKVINWAEVENLDCLTLLQK